MASYVIVTDSSADLSAQMAEEAGVQVLPLRFTVEGQTYYNWPDNREMDPRVFYRVLREGEVATTAAVNVEQYLQAMVAELQAGRDVLVLAFSSGLSATYDSARLAGEELREKYPERKLFLRGIVPELGFSTAVVTYERGEREAGESKYPLKKMISFAVEGITSFSVKPLHFVTGMGMLSILVGIGMFIYVIVSWANNNVVSGWGSIMCSLWLIGGLLMLSMGIIGEYVGKIYLEAKHRPRYAIETEI